MDEGERESGPYQWRSSQNRFVSLTDIELYRECFRRSEEILHRLHNRRYMPSAKLPPQTRRERERFAQEISELLMAITIRMFPKIRQREGRKRPIM